MKRSLWMVCMLSLAACSARGGGGGGGVISEDAADDTAVDDTPIAEDTASPDVITPDVAAPDVITPDVAAPDVIAPDVAAPDATVDAPPPVDSAGGCARDSDCMGSTWCDTATGACRPIVCTPGRASCASATRLRMCDARGSSFTDSDCPGGCSNGACVGVTPTCTAPTVMCGTTCVNTQTDASNCGACGNACATGQTCTAGACTSTTTCTSPLTRCGSTCVNTQSDVSNCGACGNACASGQTCTAGTCTSTTTCTSPLTRCGSTCVNTQSDVSNCGACGVACTSGQTCTAGACSGGTGAGSFRITSLASTGCSVVDHNTQTGDDRGGIAAGTTGIYYTGDTASARFDPTTLAATALGGVYDGLVSNLRTNTVYTLASATGPLVNTYFTGTLTSLIEFNEALGAPHTDASRRITLSTPITIPGADVGIFSGWDRLVLVVPGTTLATVYNIELPSGRVSTLGTMVMPTHVSSESWAYWGVAEHDGARVSLVYVQDSTRIARVTVPDATVTTVGTFTNLSDMASFTVAPSRGRWFFHHEYTSQFSTTTNEAFGSCPATFTMTGVTSCSTGLTLCSGACVDAQADAANCGACGRACGASQTCRAGACVTPTTLPNYTLTTPPASVTFVDVCALSGSMRVLASIDDNSTFVPTPFTFNFWGSPIAAGAQINVSSNGFISFDNMALSGLSAFGDSTAPNGVVALWYLDLVSSTTGVCYATRNTAPNRDFVIEWYNSRAYGSAGSTMTGEIVIHEADSTIDLLGQATTFSSTSTGLMGIDHPTSTRFVSGCASATGQCPFSATTRVRFAPSP